jgi:hypothetical protein
MNFRFSLFAVIIFCEFANAWADTDLQQLLQQDIEHGRLNRFSQIEAAFILSGADDPDSLAIAVRWYHDLLQTLKDYHFDAFDREGSAAKVFSYLHTSWLITYKEQATTLLDVMRRKQYNCVAATILYNLLCSDLGWATEAFETPTHTYTIFTSFSNRIMVENTTPMGFNIMRNLSEYSRYLLQFYPHNRAAQIGFDRIYAYENSKGRVIDNTELLGLLAYNRAYFAEKNENFAEAYRFVLLAQKFNKDSRSNIDFEIHLYHLWGQQLFTQLRFYEAFTVLADGYYRYRQEQALAQNCIIAMLNTLNQYGLSGDWPKSRDLLREFQTLKIGLNEKQSKSLQDMMRFWLARFIKSKERQELMTAFDLLQLLGLDDSSFDDLHRQVGLNGAGP